MKDNFSIQSKEYAVYRPTYPQALYDYLLPLVREKKAAWDCATGNGQVAAVLADSFQHVFATDISENQLANATKKENITYSIQPAEKTSFPDKTFDLITVAQAVHWFKFEEFYTEVERVIKPGGLLVLIGYGLSATGDETDDVIDHFYDTILKGCWDTERNYIDEGYETLPFPYNEINCPRIAMTRTWTVDQLIGFLNTWSGVQHYIKKNNSNPLGLIEAELRESWGTEKEKVFSFPLLLKVARLR
ncbi:MAG: class I SAM-dependent methyltransferase [Flavobacteriales bacterium]